MNYICQTCHTEHDTVPKALACFESHEPKEHVLEEAVTLEAPATREMPPVKAAELLGRAAALMHERGKTYDAPAGERSMGKAIAAFNAITGRDLAESEGWLLLTVLKAVRAQTRREPHADSNEDMIAYAALFAEARGEGR